MTDKRKFPRADAIAVAKLMCDFLRPWTERLIVAGSLRRRKDHVGDIEILYIPKFRTAKIDLLHKAQINTVDELLSCLLQNGTITKRLTVMGSETWGPKNKHATHATSHIPVDLFSATGENWYNYLVCRTGSAENNVAIAAAAQAKGWKWNPYEAGFSRISGLGTQSHGVASEREVFDFVGLPYKEPWER